MGSIRVLCLYCRYMSRWPVSGPVPVRIARLLLQSIFPYGTPTSGSLWLAGPIARLMLLVFGISFLRCGSLICCMSFSLLFCSLCLTVDLVCVGRRSQHAPSGSRGNVEPLRPRRRSIDAGSCGGHVHHRIRGLRARWTCTRQNSCTVSLGYHIWRTEGEWLSVLAVF